MNYLLSVRMLSTEKKKHKIISILSVILCVSLKSFILLLSICAGLPGVSIINPHHETTAASSSQSVFSGVGQPPSRLMARDNQTCVIYPLVNRESRRRCRKKKSVQTLFLVFFVAMFIETGKASSRVVTVEVVRCAYFHH